VNLLRLLAYLIGAILVVTLLRSVLGVVLRGVAELFRPPGTSTPTHPSKEGLGGELKKDPVCGTFISPATAIQTTAGGTTHYFCSVECRDKFHG
jgi:YHS domain-containing protein